MMIFNNPRFMIIKLPIIGMVGFLLCIVLSISFYPGGTIKQENTSGYIFTENFLSDLGRTVSPSGDNNFASMILFICALASISLSMSGFFYGTFRYFKNKFPLQGISLGIGTVLFIVSFCFLLGVGFTPANIALPPHIFFAVWFFRLIFSLKSYSKCCFMKRLLKYPTIPVPRISDITMNFWDMTSGLNVSAKKSPPRLKSEKRI